MPSLKTVLAFLKKFAYCTMFGLGCYFIYQGDVVQRYQISRTDNTVYEEPISELPIIHTYFKGPASKKLKFEEDFHIHFEVFKGSILEGINLTIGENPIKSSNLTVTLIKLPSDFYENSFQIIPTSFQVGNQAQYLVTYIFRN